MNNPKNFESEYRQANDAISPSESAMNRARCAMDAPEKKKSAWHRTPLVHAAAIVCACVMLAFVIFPSLSNIVIVNRTTKIPIGGMEAACTYDDVYDKLEAYINESNQFEFNLGGMYRNDFKAVEEALPMPTGEPEVDASAASGDDDSYSSTNVSEAGVDEADIIKTDGEYIYVMSDEFLSILKADGENTKLVSKYQVYDTVSVYEEFMGENGYYNDMYYCRINASGMYVYDDSVVVYIDSGMEESTKVYVIDTTNKEEPTQASVFAQDGIYTDSRMCNGILYTVSTKYMYSYADTIKRSVPETYIPGFCTDDNEKVLIAPEDIIVFDDDNYTYTITTAIDIGNGATAPMSSLAIFGRVDDMYASTDSIILYAYKYSNQTGSAYSPSSEDDSAVSSKTYFAETSTNLFSIKMNNGNLEMGKNANVPGTLNNQFSLSEHDGYLRIVTTCEKFNDRYGMVRTNALYVLDSELNTVGKIENLAEGEQIYSARFMGDICYFVTFRTTDPLFSVDLSDPTNPTVLGELKIPGFSNYLHSFGDGLLFGLGMAADENTGMTECLKLSMFDVSDPSEVTETACERIEGIYYSEASYNHKAILVSDTRNIIAFPVNDNMYMIYRYDSEVGFKKVSTIQMNDGYWSYGSRGMYINDNFYVIDCTSCKLIVLDMDNFTVSATLSF